MKISLVGAVVGALVAANAAAFVAVDRHFQVSADGSSSPGTSVTPTASSNRSATPSDRPTQERPAGSITSPGVATIAADKNKAWRAVNSGGCHGSVTVQRTEDMGRTWSNLARPPAGAAGALAIDGAGRLELTGQASDGCAQKTWSLAADGSWISSAAPAWAPESAKSADVIHGGKQWKACAAGSVIDIATAGDAAYVLCSDGKVRSVSGSGRAQTAYDDAGLLSIATTGDNTLAVARTTKGCDGVELAKVSDGSAKEITCVQGASKAADLTFAGDRGWLVAAHDTWTGAPTGDWSKS